MLYIRSYCDYFQEKEDLEAENEELAVKLTDLVSDCIVKTKQFAFIAYVLLKISINTL